MMRTYKLLFIGALFASLFSACKKDETQAPTIPNEEELITSLIYTLTPVGGGTPVVFSFKDLDGDGGTAPVLIEGILSANTDYTGVLTLLNESEDPALDISLEVAEEGIDHQLFYQVDDELNLTINYSDTDLNGTPIGLSTLVSTGTASGGSLVITLRHEPDKTASGVSTGDISNAGGETDIEVTFVVEVE